MSKQAYADGMRSVQRTDDGAVFPIQEGPDVLVIDHLDDPREVHDAGHP
jgi:hypothetical protein